MRADPSAKISGSGAAHPAPSAARRGLLRASAAATASALLPFGARAQAWPSQPVHLVVPLGAGSSLDVSARILAPVVGGALGQPVIVENRPGAGANVGTQFVARAAPDGYTLLYSGTGMAINPHLYRSPGFDPFKDFAPIVQMTENHLVLVVRSGLGVSTVDELVALARAKPGKLTYGAAGGVVQLGWEMFKSLAKIDLVLVQYRSVSQAVVDVVSGNLDMAFSVGTVATSHAATGRVKLLAVTDSRRREGALAALPPISESVPGFVLKGWEGVLAPAGTPAEVVARLNREFVAALAVPELRQRFVELGYDVVAGSPEDFRKTIERDYARFGKIARDARVELR